jgi:hypothetical protein
MFLNRVEMIGKYNVTGRVLLLPITGNGDINITLGNTVTLRQHAMKTYWGVDVSALDGGEWSASLPGRFKPRKRNSSVRWTGGSVDGTQRRSGHGGEDKESLLVQGIEPRSSSP